MQCGAPTVLSNGGNGKSATYAQFIRCVGFAQLYYYGASTGPMLGMSLVQEMSSFHHGFRE